MYEWDCRVSIELMFLKKAIEDKNFISFSYEGKVYKKVKPFKIENDVLKCDVGEFEIKDLKKITVLKDRF